MRDVEKIVRIVGHIREVIPRCRIFPGLDRVEIEAKLSEVGVELNSELIELYEAIGEVDNLGTSVSLLSLGDAALCYKTYRDLSGDRFTWWPSLFPLLDMNGDFQVCVDLEATDLYEIDVESGTTRHIWHDYRKLLNALLEALEIGIHSQDPVSGSLVLEKSAWAKIKEKHGAQ